MPKGIKKEKVEEVPTVPVVEDEGVTPTVMVPAESDYEAEGGFQVSDPEVLRPVELPLVVKPAKGNDWANEEQASYARIINSYAYQNPAKFATKKASLLAKLKEIGDDPSALEKYSPDTLGRGSVQYNNKNIME